MNMHGTHTHSHGSHLCVVLSLTDLYLIRLTTHNDHNTVATSGHAPSEPLCPFPPSQYEQEEGKKTQVFIFLLHVGNISHSPSHHHRKVPHYNLLKKASYWSIWLT